jgi:hemerythrin superfamily protein
MKKSTALSHTKAYPVCLVLPYHVTIYRDGYVPKGGKDRPYLTQWGRTYVELTTHDINRLEEETSFPRIPKIRSVVKEIAQKNLEHDIKVEIEKHEGISGFNSWILPLRTHGRFAEFIMLTQVKSVLRGTHLDWKKRKAGIYFTAKVQFCVTADI